VPSKRADEDAQFHHLLDNAMYDARRIQKVHKRSQLDDEIDPYESNKRQAKKGIATLHHQKPVNLRSLIETDRNNKMGPKKRSASNFSQNQARPSIDKSRPKPKSAEPRPSETKPKIDQKVPKEDKNFFIVTEENSDQSANSSFQPPPSPDVNIPPPWKTTTGDDEPVVAAMPTWANNPDYTIHATSSKPEDKTRKNLFDLFASDKDGNKK
jgi:hypothetical protein